MRRPSDASASPMSAWVGPLPRGSGCTSRRGYVDIPHVSWADVSEHPLASGVTLRFCCVALSAPKAPYLSSTHLWRAATHRLVAIIGSKPNTDQRRFTPLWSRPRSPVTPRSHCFCSAGSTARRRFVGSAARRSMLPPRAPRSMGRVMPLAASALISNPTTSSAGRIAS